MLQIIEPDDEDFGNSVGHTSYEKPKTTPYNQLYDSTSTENQLFDISMFD